MSGVAALDSRTVRLYDVGLAIWAVAWLVVAAVAVHQAQQLRQLSDAALAAGGALEQTADALAELSDLPLVGGGLAEMERGVRNAAARAEEGARQADDDIRNFSIVIGLTVALVPIVPPLAVYLPQRLAWRRERESIRSALHRGDRELDDYLACRALARLPYDDLRHLPGGDVDAGGPNRRALADAELDHIGLERPRDAR